MKVHKFQHIKEKVFIEQDLKLAQEIYNSLYFVEQIVFAKVENEVMFKRYMQRISKKDNFKKVVNIEIIKEGNVRVMLTGLNK